MTTKRVKQVGAALRSRDAMENCVKGICDCKIRESNLIDQMDDKLAEIRANYEPELSKVRTELTAMMALAQDWAENNDAEFGGKKSIKMTHGVVGFRTGMPTLKTLAGWTWDKVKAALINGSKGFTRTKVEVAKDDILAAFQRSELSGEDLAKAREAGEKILTRTDLQSIGCKVAQEESFFVEPALTEKPENRETVAA